MVMKVWKGTKEPYILKLKQKRSRLGSLLRFYEVFLSGNLNEKTLDAIFSTSFFSPSAKVVSMYGGGILSIGDKCLINGSIVLERSESKIEIGGNSFLGFSSTLNARKSISIGSNVLIAEQCLIQDHNSHAIDYLARRNDINLAIARHIGNPKMDKDFSQVTERPVHIGNDCWIGYRSIILKGVTIGDRSIVAAGSVVTNSLPGDIIAAGNPARIVKKLN